jgi:hypothetical protein
VGGQGADQGQISGCPFEIKAEVGWHFHVCDMNNSTNCEWVHAKHTTAKRPPASWKTMTSPPHTINT